MRSDRLAWSVLISESWLIRLLSLSFAVGVVAPFFAPPSDAGAASHGCEVRHPVWARELAPGIAQSALPVLPYARGTFLHRSGVLQPKHLSTGGLRWVLAASANGRASIRTDDSMVLSLIGAGLTSVHLTINFSNGAASGVSPRSPVNLTRFFPATIRGPIHFSLRDIDRFPPNASASSYFLVAVMSRPNGSGLGACRPHRSPHPQGGPPTRTSHPGSLGARPASSFSLAPFAFGGLLLSVFLVCMAIRRRLGGFSDIVLKRLLVRYGAPRQ